MRNLDKHFRCSKALKTMFALTPLPTGAIKYSDTVTKNSLKKRMMEVEHLANHMERAVEPRSAKSIESSERRQQRSALEKMAA